METRSPCARPTGCYLELAEEDTSRWRAGTEPCSTRCLVDAARSSKAGRGRFEPRGGFETRPYRPVNLARASRRTLLRLLCGPAYTRRKSGPRPRPPRPFPGSSRSWRRACFILPRALVGIVASRPARFRTSSESESSATTLLTSPIL